MPGRPWPRFRRAADPWQDWLRRAEQEAVRRGHTVPVPAWLRKTHGERRWPVSVSVIAVIILQVLLPPDYTKPLPSILLPALEGALLIGLAAANPVRNQGGAAERHRWRARHRALRSGRPPGTGAPPARHGSQDQAAHRRNLHELRRAVFLAPDYPAREHRV